METSALFTIHTSGCVDTASTDEIFDLSNVEHLGHSEVELVQKLIDGVQLLIQVCPVVYSCKCGLKDDIP